MRLASGVTALGMRLAPARSRVECSTGREVRVTFPPCFVHARPGVSSLRHGLRNRSGRIVGAPSQQTRGAIRHGGRCGGAPSAARGGHPSHGASANEWGRRVREDSSVDVDAAAAALVESHVKLARLQGAALGAALTGLELSPVLGPAGELTAGAAALGIAADVTTLAWIQARLALHRAAIHGQDASKVDVRLGELAVFFGVAEVMHSAGYASARVAGKAGARLTHRHLRGDALAAVKAVARMGGVKFTRKRMLELLPLVNVPVLAASNGIVVRRLGAKARNYYRTLPVGA